MAPVPTPSNVVPSPPVDDASACAVCGKASRTRRCSKCQKVNYCSVECQRVDWNAGHKIKCAVAADSLKDTAPLPPPPQEAAWNELQGMVLQMSPQEAHQRFQMAQDEIERLEQQNKTVAVEENKKERSETETKRTRTRGTAASTVLDVSENNSTSKVAALCQTSQTSQASTESETELIFGELGSNQRDWIYAVEEMPNISSYQVTLWRKPQQTDSSLPDPRNVIVSMLESSRGNATIVTLCSQGAIAFSARFPRVLKQVPETKNLVQRQSDCLSLRLQCRDSFDCIFSDDDTTSASTSLATVRSICCRYCEQTLLTAGNDSQGIQKVLRLPKGYWDEITDYLICYNGQPAVDFSSSSTSAQQNLAMEDSAVLVLHSDNVGSGICVLAIEGYGEESSKSNSEHGKVPIDAATFRGPRDWRDLVGGATLCCSQCCAVLGFASIASPETFRLLKHHLSTRDDVEWSRLYTCASFVAHEIVRYAESKAIYTFVISVRADQANNHERPKCILLKLLSWDTRQAKRIDSSMGESVDRLDFRRVVKVIYEVADDRQSSHDYESEDGDPTKWNWGGVDLCCMPDGTRLPGATKEATTSEEVSNQASAASVRMWLSRGEWDELHQDLVESSKCFSKAVADATILVKLGPQEGNRDNDVIGLGALPFL